ncbi:B12-binding domain-containing radical SAM protein [Nanoarchaeota archaeon]
MKIQLFRPPLNNWYDSGNINSDLVSVPSELLLVAINRLKWVRDHDLKILDGMGCDIKKVKKKINADVVGVTSLYVNYENALEILRTAKEKGAKTVIGGPHTTAMYERILKNRSFVDYVVVGDGSKTFEMIVDGCAEEEIPNLAFRRDGEIVKNKREYDSIHGFCNLDFIKDLTESILSEKIRLLHSKLSEKKRLSHSMSLKKIADPRNELLISKKYRGKAIPIAFTRGCSKADLEGRCAHCSIDGKYREIYIKVFGWDSICNYCYFGSNKYFETGDSPTLEFLEEFLEHRPNDLKDVQFRFYGNFEYITPRYAEVLKELNTFELFLGLESVNDQILANIGKQHRREDIEKGIDVLTEKGIFLHLPFMYGLPGETEETARESYEFAKGLVEKGHNLMIMSSHAIPLPGSKLFNDLLKNEKAVLEYPGNLLNDDILDYKELVKLNLKYSTKIDYDFAKEMIRKTKALTPNNQTTSLGINE